VLERIEAELRLTREVHRETRGHNAQLLSETREAKVRNLADRFGREEARDLRRLTEERRALREEQRALREETRARIQALQRATDRLGRGGAAG
jgi:hypothetical protein